MIIVGAVKKLEEKLEKGSKLNGGGNKCKEKKDDSYTI